MEGGERREGEDETRRQGEEAREEDVKITRQEDATERKGITYLTMMIARENKLKLGSLYEEGKLEGKRITLGRRTSRFQPAEDFCVDLFLQTMSKNQSLNFKGCSIFRYRIIASTLTGKVGSIASGQGDGELTELKAIRISDIRANTESPGLRDFEASFLRMIEKLSNGCMIEINDTGTKMRYKPGVLVGGTGLEHDCGKTRGSVH